MEMKKINAGKLRAIGYDGRARVLQVQLDDGTMLQYGSVGEDIWRRFSGSGAAWSFYRDNIEEEFAAKRVSEAEVDHADLFMKKLGMTDAHRAQAITWFKQGATPDFDIEPVYQRFISICGHTRKLKEMLLVSLIVMALADGEFHPEEEALLTHLAGRLGYGPEAFKRLMDMVLNQTHFAGGQPDPAKALEDAYKALGVSKDSTDAEVKRAWRKLMSQYHPDKLMGQGMPEDMIVMATEQAKEIQLAYDLIKKSRGM